MSQNLSINDLQEREMANTTQRHVSTYLLEIQNHEQCIKELQNKIKEYQSRCHHNFMIDYMDNTNGVVCYKCMYCSSTKCGQTAIPGGPN